MGQPTKGDGNLGRIKQYIDLMTPMEAYEKGYNKAMAQLADMTEECKQMGRQEVVEWVEAQEDTPTYSVCEGTNLKIPEPPAKIIYTKAWQAQLQEWGIKNDN